MATPTYTAIASITLGSSASSVEFSSIPQDYRDLVLVHNGTGSVADIDTVDLTFNSDSGSNYSRVFMNGDGSSASSAADSSTSLEVGVLVQDMSQNIFQVLDYSATDKHKTCLVRTNTDERTRASAGRYASTSAITTIEVSVNSLDFATGSTFALYGIAS